MGAGAGSGFGDGALLQAVNNAQPSSAHARIARESKVAGIRSLLILDDPSERRQGAPVGNGLAIPPPGEQADPRIVRLPKPTPQIVGE